MENIDFSSYSPEEFRDAIGTVQDELLALSQSRQNLLKEERTLSTLMYMLFPKEAAKDGYLSATMVLTNRLNAAKRRKKRNPCSIKKCGEPEHCKGFCSTHYSRENRKLLLRKSVSARNIISA